MGQLGNQRQNKKVHGQKWKWKHNGLKCFGFSKSFSKREIYSNTGLHQEIIKISNNLTLHLNELEKGKRTRPKASRRKVIIKIRV